MGVGHDGNHIVVLDQFAAVVVGEDGNDVRIGLGIRLDAADLTAYTVRVRWCSSFLL